MQKLKCDFLPLSDLLFIKTWGTTILVSKLFYPEKIYSTNLKIVRGIISLRIHLNSVASIFIFHPFFLCYYFLKLFELCLYIFPWINILKITILRKLHYLYLIYMYFVWCFRDKIFEFLHPFLKNIKTSPSKSVWVFGMKNKITSLIHLEIFLNLFSTLNNLRTSSKI